MAGLDLVRRLRALRPGIAVVIASGFLGTEQRAAADLRVDAMIVKPLTRETLRQASTRRDRTSAATPA